MDGLCFLTRGISSLHPNGSKRYHFPTARTQIQSFSLCQMPHLSLMFAVCTVRKAPVKSVCQALYTNAALFKVRTYGNCTKTLRQRLLQEKHFWSGWGNTPLTFRADSVPHLLRSPATSSHTSARWWSDQRSQPVPSSHQREAGTSSMWPSAPKHYGAGHLLTKLQFH